VEISLSLKTAWRTSRQIVTWQMSNLASTIKWRINLGKEDKTDSCTRYQVIPGLMAVIPMRCPFSYWLAQVRGRYCGDQCTRFCHDQIFSVQSYLKINTWTNWTSRVQGNSPINTPTLDTHRCGTIWEKHLHISSLLVLSAWAIILISA